jgi:hypothetical protein
LPAHTLPRTYGTTEVTKKDSVSSKRIEERVGGMGRLAIGSLGGEGVIRWVRIPTGVFFSKIVGFLYDFRGESRKEKIIDISIIYKKNPAQIAFICRKALQKGLVNDNLI